MKVYVKPDLFFESFELSQSIAACGFDVNLVSTDVCETYTDPDIHGEELKVFMTDCTVNVEDYCYTTGQQDEDTKLFRS